MAHGDQAAKARAVLPSHMACQSIDVGDGKAEAQWSGECRDEKDEYPKNKAPANEQLHEGEGRGEGPRQRHGHHVVAQNGCSELLRMLKFGEARRDEESTQRQPQ